MGTVLSLLSGIVSLGLKVWGWFSTRSEQKAGADAQSGRDNAAAEAALASIAQAEADAPKTDDAVEQRLKEHSL